MKWIFLALSIIARTFITAYKYQEVVAEKQLVQLETALLILHCKSHFRQVSVV